MRLGDFPIGSPESRAAARMHLAHLRSSRKRIRIISNVAWTETDSTHVHFGAWQEWQDGTMGQFVYVPSVWLKPGEAVPICPDCGTPFKKTGEYPEMVGFTANCIDKHDPELVGAGNLAKELTGEVPLSFRP
jgi:hypothetical protein